MAGYGDNEGFTAYAIAVGYVLPDGTTDAQKTRCTSTRFSGGRSV